MVALMVGLMVGEKAVCWVELMADEWVGLMVAMMASLLADLLADLMVVWTVVMKVDETVVKLAGQKVFC